MKLRRSLLFVPGARPERFEKALAAGADLVCIDLEDAVPPDGKAAARAAAIAFLNAHRPATELGLRFNSLRSAEGLRDILAFKEGAGRADFIMLPKIAEPAEIGWARDLIGATASHIFPILESPAAIERAADILRLPMIECALFGAVDYTAETGGTLDWEGLLPARARLQNAAAAAGVTLFDVPYLDVNDAEGLIAETRRARRLGIVARAAIHPAQIAPIHEALAPSEAELLRARRIVEAFAAAKGGAALLDGKMIELPVIKSAERLLAVAAAQSGS